MKTFASFLLSKATFSDWRKFYSGYNRPKHRPSHWRSDVGALMSGESKMSHDSAKHEMPPVAHCYVLFRCTNSYNTVGICNGHIT